MNSDPHTAWASGGCRQVPEGSLIHPVRAPMQCIIRNCVIFPEFSWTTVVTHCFDQLLRNATNIFMIDCVTSTLDNPSSPSLVIAFPNFRIQKGMRRRIFTIHSNPLLMTSAALRWSFGSMNSTGGRRHWNNGFVWFSVQETFPNSNSRWQDVFSSYGPTWLIRIYNPVYLYMIKVRFKGQVPRCNKKQSY